MDAFAIADAGFIGLAVAGDAFASDAGLAFFCAGFVFVASADRIVDTQSAVTDLFVRTRMRGRTAVGGNAFFVVADHAIIAIRAIRAGFVQFKDAFAFAAFLIGTTSTAI